MRGYQYNFVDELIIDSFAGGGGASTGIELATGRIVNVAINHSRTAIEMHQRNHPYTTHYCEDVRTLDPREITNRQPVALLWGSPDCTHFSRAKGGTPVSKHIRGLAWVLINWAAKVHPRVIIMENVEEFMKWGPVKDGRPIKEKEGQTFKKFIAQFHSLGYEVEWRVLTACDYGAPTSRKRFFLIARCDGQPIIFPAPTHGKGEGLKPYRTAAECVDMSLPMRSIFKRKKPLADNTLKRIARGLDKFVIKSAQPYIMSNNTNNAPHSINEPLPTATTGNRNYFVAPSLVRYNSEKGGDQVRGQELTKPLGTLDTSNRYALTAAYLTKYFGGEKQAGAPIDAPLPTITAIDHNGLVAVNLMSRHGDGSDGRGSTLDAPLPTITGTNHEHLVATNLIKYYGSGESTASVREPLPTVTVKARFGLSASHLCTLRHNMDGQSLNEPLSTITAAGGHHALIKTHLEKLSQGEALNLGYWREVRELLNKYAGYDIAEDEILVLEINGCGYYIADIYLRMLEPFELAAGQGFPPDYVLQVNGSYTKAAQTEKIGNSVCPVMSEALVRANLPELCGKKIKTMAALNKALTA